MAQQRRSTKANLRRGTPAEPPSATASAVRPGSGPAESQAGRPQSGAGQSSPVMQRPPTGSAGVATGAGSGHNLGRLSSGPGATGTQMRQAKRTPSPAARKNAAGSGVSEAPPPRRTKEKVDRGDGAEIGQFHRRGWSLNFKFTFFICLVVLLISALFGAVALNEVRDKLLAEVVRTGYDQTIAAHAFATKITNRFRLDDDKKPASAGVRQDKFSKYHASDNFKEDLAHLQRIVKGDPRIYDIVVMVSFDPAAEPNTPLVNGAVDEKGNQAKPKDFKPSGELEIVKLPGGHKADSDVRVFWAEYNGERCLNFSMPIESQGEKKHFSMLKLAMSASQIDAEVRSITIKLGIIGTILLLVCLGLAHFFGNAISRPINTLVGDINMVAKGDLDHKSHVPNETKDEIGLLAMAFNRMTANLKAARELERDSERIAGELQTAQAIHAKLMPEKLPQLPGLDIFTAYHCAKEVGGDYYDFIPVGDAEHLALCVADVSGKGIPGSMVMGFTRTILRMMAMNNLSAADVLAKTNFHVARDIKRGMFVTCVYAILNVRTREMTVASAGHNPMLIWRASNQQIEKVRPNGIALGFDKGPVFNRTVKEQKVKLFPGDRVVLYTDGVVEAMNEAREEWSDEKLDEFTLKHATLPSKEYVRLLIKELEDHKGSAEQHDDITVSTFKVV